MRVLFDGFWWADGPAANRTVQREFILAWRDAFPKDDLIVAVRRRADATVPAGIGAVTTRLWPQSLSNGIELPLLARRTRADVVIAHNYAPRSGPAVVFIHDAMFLDHPGWFSTAERAYFAAMLPMAKRARSVATSTRTEAARIERLSPSLAPVHVTGLAVPSALALATPRRPAGLEDLATFALTVGRLNIRKNLERLLAAAGSAERITRATPLLVVGSGEHSGRASHLPAIVQTLADTGKVRFLGRIEDDELAWLYQHTSLALSLTRDEGFGMTPIEAAHFGAPLLVSDIPVHRETVGDVAAFVSPDAPLDEIGAQIDAAWGAPGSARGRSWSWADAVAVLRQLV